MSSVTHHDGVHQTCGLCPCYVPEESNDQRMDAHVSAGIVCVWTCITDVVGTTVYTVTLWGRKSLKGTRCKST